MCPDNMVRGFKMKLILYIMNIETINNWTEALSLVVLILGIMAILYIGLCLINQKRNRKW